MSNVKPSRTAYLAALRNKVQEMSSPKSNTQKQDDDRYWKPERDVAGNGSAIIRFLPAKTGEEFPFVQMHTHGFQGPTSKWFIDNCPTSIGETCPVCKANTALWNSGNESDKKLASARKRKLNYISNILVVADPKHPENNGKVFLYRYGKKIWDKIKDMINPPAEFADLSPIDPFDAEEGVNFKLRITKQDGFPNYDRSTFDTTPVAFGDEDYRSEILDQLYSLNELIDPAHFKSYADLQKRFNMVTGEGSSEDEYDDKPAIESAPDEDEQPVAKQTTKPKTTKPATAKTRVATPVTSADDSDDFFANLSKQSDQD